jgi:hypothetical protein
MEEREVIPKPAPSWRAVSLAGGLVAGAFPLLVGVVVAEAAQALGGCREFGDFGCGGYWAMGLFACPATALGGAVAGGLGAARMARAGGHSRRQVWKRCLGLAVLSAMVLGPLSLSVMAWF